MPFKYVDVLSKYKVGEATPFICDRIESEDDPGIYVELVTASREGGEWFVLNMDGKKIGFQTAEYWRDAQYEKLPDGTKVWHIGVIGCDVFVIHSREPGSKEFTNTDHFSSKEEQDLALELFAEALTHYNGSRKQSRQGGVKARVEYTRELIVKLERGDFIK